MIPHIRLGGDERAAALTFMGCEVAIREIAGAGETAEPNDDVLVFAARMGGPGRVHVVSDDGEEELRAAFERSAVAGWFAGVHGSPTAKSEHIGRVLVEREVDAADALIVGDGRADFETARALGVPFVFVAATSEWPEGDQVVSGAGRGFVAADWPTLLSWLPAPPALTGKQRRHLRALGHSLEPVVHIGHHGVSGTVLAQVDGALVDHELIKLRVGQNAPLSTADAGAAVVRGTGSCLAQKIGRVLLVYRPSDGAKQRRIELPEPTAAI